jgi:hypothetical protein
MATSKNKICLIYFSLFLVGCQTFNLNTHQSPDGDSDRDLHTVHVTSNRVRQECGFLDASDENHWRHQYVMYILNEKNEVFEIMHPINQVRETCEANKKRIEKILSSDLVVKICLREGLVGSERDKEVDYNYVDFGKLGRHLIKFEGLEFDSICNLKECFRNEHFYPLENCPGFPLK